MYINDLTTTKSLKSVTVTLSYDEVRDIANGLYYLNKMVKCDKIAESLDVKPSEYNSIGAKASFLFDMVKHGMIQPETIAKFNNVSCETENDEDNDNSEPVIFVDR